METAGGEEPVDCICWSFEYRGVKDIEDRGVRLCSDEPDSMKGSVLARV